MVPCFVVFPSFTDAFPAVSPKAAGKLKSYFLEREGQTNKCSTKKTAGKASVKDENTTKHGSIYKFFGPIFIQWAEKSSK